jgi:hypothetical protein
MRRLALREQAKQSRMDSFKSSCRMPSGISIAQMLTQDFNMGRFGDGFMVSLMGGKMVDKLLE